MDTEALSRVRRRGRIWTAVAIIALVLLWAVVMFFRMEIRAHWWAYRLTRVESDHERNYYLACLAAVGNKSLGAVDRLLQNPRPEVREMGVIILEHCTPGVADKRLVALLSDENEDVAIRAALALASREDVSSLLRTLRDCLLEHPGGPDRHAAVALQRIGGAEAEQALLDALPHATDPNLRAQIIDSLGMLGSEAAVPILTDMLADERQVTILPYSQRSALQALAARQQQLLNKGIDPQTVMDALQKETTVAAIAARSLRLITDAPVDEPPTQPAAYPNNF